jgi:hypothetical protein
MRSSLHGRYKPKSDVQDLQVTNTCTALQQILAISLLSYDSQKEYYKSTMLCCDDFRTGRLLVPVFCRSRHPLFVSLKTSTCDFNVASLAYVDTMACYRMFRVLFSRSRDMYGCLQHVLYLAPWLFNMEFYISLQDNLLIDNKLVDEDKC